MIDNSQKNPSNNDLRPPAPPMPPVPPVRQDIPTPPVSTPAVAAPPAASAAPVKPAMAVEPAKVTSQPIFQASPSGGVVATLQPGQAGFEDMVQAESDRKDGFVLQGAKRIHQQTDSAGFKQVTTSAVDYAQMNLKKEEANEAPRSTKNLKVGKEKVVKEKKKWLFPAVAGAVVLLVLGFTGFYFWEKEQRTQETLPQVAETMILNYWGLWEPNRIMTQVFKDFEAANPGVSVVYSQKSITGYRAELENVLASGNGPDVFRFHASWRPALAENLSLMPETLMTKEEFGQQFYSVFAEELANDDGAIQAMPLMYDSLALVYNKDLLTERGIEPPKTWSEFAVAAEALTQRDENGFIQQAGAAIGLADNVDFFSDIFGLLALQNGIDLENPDEQKMAEVLKYYTDFYNLTERRVWDSDFDNSTQSFARGDVAMILAPSWLIHDIFAINPNLNVGVASAPQLNVQNPIDWSTHWVEGVNIKSPRADAAWKLLEYMTSSPVLEALNQEQTLLRRFGEIYPRTDMADLLAGNEYTQPYLVNARAAASFPLNDKTFDGAVNEQNKALVTEAINSQTGERKTALTAAAVSLVDGMRENLIDYGYIPDPRAMTPPPSALPVPSPAAVRN